MTAESANNSLDDFKVNRLTPVEMADLFKQLDEPEQLIVFNELTKDFAVSVFEHLAFKDQLNIVHHLTPSKTAIILSDMSPDDRTAFLNDLPSATVNALLKLLPLEDRTIALTLLGYPKNSVGRLMTTDYIDVNGDKTVQETLDYIRTFGKDSETINVIYVINDEGVLIDDIRIRELLFAPLNQKIKDLAHGKFVSLSVNDNEESAIKVFLKNDRVALPVIDNEGILLGIVTVDDVLNLINEEDTKDIQKIGGSEALDYPYMHTPFFDLMKKRASWLIVLFLGELLTATTMGYFEEQIAQAVVLALFLPLIISSGGNSGSQASTLIIRALVIGEITLRDWWKIMRREILSGLFLGTILGSIGFIRIMLWSSFSNIYGPHWFIVGITIFISLIGVVLLGTVSGAMLPLILKKLKFDPAAASAPLVATLVDVTGIIIYFITASIIMKGTLL
jgi:magnesium transporter